MTEMVVSSLIDRLVPLLTQEAKLLRGIHGEVADIKDEPESIQSFLKDADARVEAPSNMSHRGSPVRKETSLYFSPSLPESIFPSAMSPSDSQSPLFFPDNMSPKFSHSNSIELIFPPARSETTDSSQNDEEIIQKPFISSFSHLFPPGTTSDSDSANSVCDYGPTTHSISLLFPANESDTEAEMETGSLAFNGTTPNLSHSIMQFYLSHSIMQLFPPARSPSQTDSSENYVINRTDFDGCIFNGTPPAPLLTKEAKPLRGIRGEFADIKDELESVRSFLKDADARVAAEEDISFGVKTWVKQVLEVAFRIDVAIDRYLLYVAPCDPHRRGFTSFVRKTTHSLKTLIPRRKIASEIQEIKASVQKIKARSERYCFQSIGQGSSNGARNVRWQDHRMHALFFEDVDVVGIESPKDELIGWLIEGHSYRTVVSVVGMGGLGKTILAKKVYDHHMVRENFDCHAWISVSQSYNMMDLVRGMVKQFCEARKEFPPEGIDSADKPSLISKAREYLQEKRYVVVFDDVWEIDFWGEIEHALPNNTKGPRILITTQKLGVANFCKKSSHVRVHNLQPLLPNKAWELFCKKAFQFELGGHCPLMLEKSSHNILEKCEGLPLAIVAIGGLLSTKDKTLFEWKKLHDSLGFELRINSHLAVVSKILSLSCEDLPYNLKSCFLYLGMYPEGYSISCGRLIRQWIAEGFVKAKEGKTFEEVAQEYLTELIHRSLVQVSKVNFDGKVRQCRLHHLFREIVLQKMKDLSFCHVLSKQESYFEGLTRRMSIDGVSYSVLKGFEDSHIHSLLLFNLDELPKSFSSTFFVDFKLLKIMDFEDAPLDCIPEDVGGLFHLRYLSFRNTKVKMLPKSIGKLQNLETLDLKQSLVCDIPVEINKLRKLRHFIAYHCNYQITFSLAQEKGVKIPKGVGSLMDLQKLYHVELNHGGVDFVKELGQLSQLRKLGVKNLSKETMSCLCISIERMSHLQSLDISSISEDEIIDLQTISSPPQCLQRIYLKACLEKLPGWIPRLQHLVRLKIFWSRLNEDPLKALQNLPNLLELDISQQAYSGEQLHFRTGGFPKLRKLTLRYLDELNSLIIDVGALPLLENLEFGPSPKLKEVPFGIHHLRNLKRLRFYDMSKEFEDSLNYEVGPCYWIVEHIPAIFLSYKVGTQHGSYDSRCLRSKNLERSRAQIIN